MPGRQIGFGRGDRGDIVLGWLTRITVILALVGVVLFDAISLASTKANVSDQGAYAAREASSAWDESHDLQASYDAAVVAATEQDPQNVVGTKDFRIDADGTVHLSVSRDAPTLVLSRWDRTAKWAHVESRAVGRSVAY